MEHYKYQIGEIYKPPIGLPQGSLIAPKLFNIYLNAMWKEVERDNPGIMERTIAYADDLTIVGCSKAEWESIKKKSTEYKLRLNMKKTKRMGLKHLTEVEEVPNFKFLGTHIKLNKIGIKGELT